MKRDMELIRAILRHVQARNSISPEEVEIDGHEDWIVSRHVEMLADAGFLQTAGTLRTEELLIIPVIDLTWEGHDFVAALENEGIWAKIKQAFPPSELAGMPLALVKGMGLKLLEAYAMQKIGLTSG